MNSIVYISNFEDMKFLETSLKSLRFFNDQIDVFILTDENFITKDIKKYLEKYKVHLVSVDEIYQSIFSNIQNYSINRWTKFVFYRLIIPYIKQLNEYKRILYIDTDTIFMQNFKFIFDLKMNYYYGMFYWPQHCNSCKGGFEATLRTTYDYIQSKNVKLQRFPKKYYNAGVILFDNVKMQAEQDMWTKALSDLNRVFDTNYFIHNEQIFLNMFFQFDEFNLDNWIVNANKLSEKTVIGHYYSANIRQKNRKYCEMKANTVKFNIKLFRCICQNMEYNQHRIKTKISSIIKNEHKYLKEWIMYHLDLGFDTIDLYEDFGSDSHESITCKFPNVRLIPLQKLKDAGIINDDNYQQRQRVALMHNFLESQFQYDWIANLDVDEFMMFEDGYSLQRLLSEFANYPGIYLYWKNMSANRHIKSCQRTIKSYDKMSNYMDDMQYEFKSLFNLNRVLRINGNHHIVPNGVTTKRQRISSISVEEFHEKTTFEKAWINHYFTKSWADWCDRIYNRGNVTFNLRHLLEFFDYNPDMIDLREQLVTPLFRKRPKSSIWLDKEQTLLYTGKTVDRTISDKINEHIKNMNANEIYHYIETQV